MLPKKTADILVASVSARAFAASAQRAGYSPAVIDGFADTDTQQHSTACYQVALQPHGGFDGEALQKTFAQCLQDCPALSGWVVGSGFESCPDVLAMLSQALPLIGNTPQVLDFCARRLESKDNATSLGIAGPPDINTLPYIYKESGSNGGGHIRFQTAETTKSLRENYLSGTTISHLFLADGERIHSVGLSSQWQSKHDPEYPFCYGGSFNRCPLSHQQCMQLEEWSERLVRDLGLRGLNNIDYLYSADRLYFLEINPRLSASFSLYDGHTYNSLLDAHIRACNGDLSKGKDDPVVRAQAVVYAQANACWQDGFEWSEDMHDRSAQNIFSQGEPVCSVSAQGDTVASTLSALQSTIRKVHIHLRADCNE